VGWEGGEGQGQGEGEEWMGGQGVAVGGSQGPAIRVRAFGDKQAEVTATQAAAMLLAHLAVRSPREGLRACGWCWC
jgi:hypothetical protein